MCTIDQPDTLQNQARRAARINVYELDWQPCETKNPDSTKSQGFLIFAKWRERMDEFRTWIGISCLEIDQVSPCLLNSSALILSNSQALT